jgi:hypothetical protein
MKIEKISEDNFTLQQQGEEYVLLMGEITRDTPRPFTIKISEVEDSSKVAIDPKCGCTSSERTIIDSNTLTTTITYKNCDTSFKKTVVIINNKKTTNLKIQGTCHN